MTTTVTVKTHDRRAKVMKFPLVNGKKVEGAEWQTEGWVDENSEGEFVVHDGQDILVQEEMPKD